MSKYIPEGSVECLECGGDGHFDSGGTTPWGEWINVPCGRCGGNGYVSIDSLTAEEEIFLRDLGIIE